MEHVDVLIVGGGPAGLAAAEMAARSGSVLVVHKDAEVGRPVRTSGGSWLADVTRLGLPPSLYHTLDTLVFAGPTTSANFTFRKHKLVVLDITATYKYLETLAERAGAIIALSTRLTDVKRAEDGRYLCVLQHRQEVRQISARYVVDASGFQRAVLSRIDLDVKPNRYGLGAEAEYKDLSGDQRRAILFVGLRYSPGGYGWVFPTAQGTVRVGIGVTRPEIQASPGKLLADFINSDAARDLGIRVGDLVEEHGGVVPAIGPSKRLLYDGVIAVGDSAGQVLPIVGEGIRFCIDSGRHAGTAVAAALQDPSNQEKHLEGYQNWWLRTHHKQFELAQAINVRITGYKDSNWDAGVKQLAMLDGDMLATLLRVEPVPAALVLYLLRNPRTAINYIRRRTGRRIAGILRRRQ